VQTLLNLLSSVALLVWGTHIVRTGILRVFGPNLREILARSVGHRFTAFLSGFAVTALLQSSSATALITSSFVARGLIALGPALVVMLGADLGTAVMAVVFSFDLRWLSPILLFGGIVVFLSRKSTRAGQVGRIAIGLGLIILALQLVMLATRPIANAHEVRALFASLSGDLLLDILIGALFAVLSWSSLAVVLLCAAFVSAAVVTVPVAISLVIGANLGSGLLALMINLRVPGVGRHVAIGNLVFKLTGCVLFGLALTPVAELLARSGADPRFQVLIFHVLFNAALALIFLFLTDPIARRIMAWVPVTTLEPAMQEARHLDRSALQTPVLALANASREVLRISDTIEQMLAGMMQVVRTGNAELATGIVRLDDEVDRRYTAIKLYMTQINREGLDSAESLRWTEIMQLTINLEHVGDILEGIVRDLKEKQIANRLSFSAEGVREIEVLHARLVANLHVGLSMFLGGDPATAEQLLAEKAAFRDLERQFASSHLDRLAGQSLRSIETSSLHLDIISDLRRINSFLCSTAYPILERAGRLRQSRLRAAPVAPAGSGDPAAT
jgi:phosphate:Na+ symporter